MNDEPKLDQELVTLISLPSELEAAPLVAALEIAGINSTMTGGFTAGFIAEAPGDVDVKIFRRDLPAARQVLEELELTGEKIDWSKVDVGEPLDE